MKKLLSIIIPVYNEEATIKKVIEKVSKTDLGIDKELIVVDDYSKDNTKKILKSLEKKHKLKLIFKPKNGGKGTALREGFKHAKGDIITIHDADFEYNTEDLKYLIKPILERKYQVVYGSRFLNFKANKTIFYYGNKFLSLMTTLIYLNRITDMETCYKVFDAKVIKSIPLTGKGFEIEPEMTSKILKKGIKIKEFPIKYNPRTAEEGKKIKKSDGIKALWTLIRNRL